MTGRRTAALTIVVALAAGCSSGDDPSGGDTAPVTTEPTSTEPADTQPADTQPADTAAPATDPADTDPPATQPPATDPSATEPARAATYDFSAVGPIVDAFVADNGLNGAGLVVVERDDGIVHEQYWGEFDVDRISLIASASKMVTAGVLARLADDGLLDLDAPVAEQVDWGAGNPAITPAQLVSNSSGLVGLGPDPGYAPYLCQFLPAGTLTDCGASIFTTPDDDADVIPPDTEFRYGGAQWQVAGALAETVSGRSWSELIEEIYVEPCGLSTFGYNNHFTQLGPGGFAYPDGFDGDLSLLADTDNPNLEGGAYTNARDYAALLLMHLRDGRCGDVQVLSTDALGRLHADRVDEAYGGEAGPGRGYGMGWWVDRESGRIADPGAYGAYPWLDLDDGYGAYLVIEQDAGLGAALAEQLADPIHDAILTPR